MLRKPQVCLAISKYSQFLRESAGKFPNIRGADRGRAVAQDYRALSANDLEQLAIRAADAPFITLKRRPRSKQQPHAYATFVKHMYFRLPGPATQRMKTLAALWREQKKKGQHPAKKNVAADSVGGKPSSSD